MYMSMVTETRWDPDLMLERDAFLWTTMKEASEVAIEAEINARNVRAKAEESFLISISISPMVTHLVRPETGASFICRDKNLYIPFLSYVFFLIIRALIVYIFSYNLAKCQQFENYEMYKYTHDRQMEFLHTI